MTKHLFDQLPYDEEWNGRYGEIPFPLGGKNRTISLVIDGEADDPVADSQKEAFDAFMQHWPTLESEMLESLLFYYNEEEKFAYGPDDPAESAAWWPDIDTPEAMAEALSEEVIIVPEDFMQEDGRRIYILFNRAWGGEDLDDNGVAVAFLNEEVEEIGYKDIVF